MKVLQIGYGKMGNFICKILADNPRVTELFVYDRKFSYSSEVGNIRFLYSLDGFALASFDCAFVVTPADTHCSVMEMLIKSGVKKIYVEKPLVMSDEEYKRIQSIKGDARIVTGYILRQSEPLQTLQNAVNGFLRDGYRLEFCTVTYQKYLPASAEERAKGDIGVFEEIVHVWDLLFNFFNFKRAEWKSTLKKIEADPERAGRTIFAKINYFLRFEDSQAMLKLTSSFRAQEKKREFFFTYKNENGDQRIALISFDNDDGNDTLSITDGQGNVLCRESSRSDLKLARQMEQAFVYFETGEPSRLAMFEENQIISDLMCDSGVKLY